MLGSITNDLIAENSPVNMPRPIRYPDVTYVRTSRIQSESLVGVSEVATASGTVGSSNRAILTTTLSPSTSLPNTRNMAVPFITIYEGTSAVGSMQLYPGQGAGISAGKFPTDSGYDYAAYNGTNSVFRVSIFNSTGTTANIYAITQWKFIQNNFGRAQQS